MLTENQLIEIRSDVAEAHYFGLKRASEGRVPMSLLSTRMQVEAITVRFG
jgi:hypothetical protein